MPALPTPLASFRWIAGRPGALPAGIAGMMSQEDVKLLLANFKAPPIPPEMQAELNKM